MSNKFIRVEKCVDRNISPYDFEGSVSDLMGQLAFWEGEHGKTVELRVVPYGHDGGMDFELWHTRDETEKERDKRLVKARKLREKNKVVKEKKEVGERKQYERLRKKFAPEGGE